MDESSVVPGARKTQARREMSVGDKALSGEIPEVGRARGDDKMPFVGGPGASNHLASLER